MFIHRFLKYGMAVCTFLCMMAAIPSWADICFLPTGSCEQGALTRTSQTKSCDDYLVPNGPYYSEKQQGMDCESADVPGCTLYSCTMKTCAARGYNLTDYQKRNSYNDTSAWSCEQCRQGGDTYWKCSAVSCPGQYTTASHCASDETLVVPEGTQHKSGNDACGICKKNSELQCKNPLRKDIPTGCYTCEQEANTGEGGIDCYRCKAMENGYLKEADYNLRYDDSCYDRKEKGAADGGLCVKPIEKVCPVDQYKKVENTNGKDLCKCRDYVYDFEITPSSAKNLHFTAAGGDQSISIVSKRTGNEEEGWDFAVPSNAGSCSISKGNGAITVSCPTNPSERAKSFSFTLTQTQEDKVTIHTQVINVTIDADKCAKGQLSNTCADASSVAKENGTSSDAGQICYDCKNDACGNGYTRGASAPAAVGYDVYTLESGDAVCYKLIEPSQEPETCPAGYDAAPKTCARGYHQDTFTRTDGEECYRCAPDECPAGKRCTDDPVCPNGMTCTGKVDCAEVQIGDTKKYYDCRCKALNCGDGYDTDDQACDCKNKRCEVGYDERVTTCEDGWKTEAKGKSGDADCNKCVEETCPTGKSCKPYPYCKDGTNCAPNPNIECKTVKLGAVVNYYDCTCKISASSCQDGYVFDDNRCECRAADCPVGYKTETASCPVVEGREGFNLEKSGKSGDADCGKCVAKTCPAGQTCTDDKICPNGQSCSGNNDVECEIIQLGEHKKYTNCKCKLSGKKDGYTLDEGNCKWNKAECPSGTAVDIPAAACPTGDTGGYHVTDLADKSGENTCKRCDANTCPSGKSCTPYPVWNAGDATGNGFVNCKKIKLGANWGYYDCTCNISDAACGEGKKANTWGCVCESCEGYASAPSGPYSCEAFTCGGQTRYKNCNFWGSQWKEVGQKTSKCNSAKVASDGKTYYNTSEICQCSKGSLSSNCGVCGVSERCVANGSSTEDGKACYSCVADSCQKDQYKDPTECQRLTSNDPHITYYAVEQETTPAGTKCYVCFEKCTPDACEDFPYTDSNFIKNVSSYYEACNPGCNEAMRYKCRDGYAPETRSDGKVVCGPKSTGKTKAQCDSENAGWEYLGFAATGVNAQRDWEQKYTWPNYKVAFRSCDGYMYGRKYGTVCGVYGENAAQAETNYNTVENMNNLGYCCEAYGGTVQFNLDSWSSVGTTQLHCCWQAEGCKKTSSSSTQQQTQSKCSKGVEVPESSKDEYTRGCGSQYKKEPRCEKHDDGRGNVYYCCQCIQH